VLGSGVVFAQNKNKAQAKAKTTPTATLATAPAIRQQLLHLLQQQGMHLKPLQYKLHRHQA